MKVEARSCPQCGAGEAMPEGASWANPALACALFVADVRALMTARRAEASSAKMSLSRRLQRASPSGSAMASYSSARQSGSRRGSEDARARRPPADYRWGGGHAVAPMPTENSGRAPLPVHPQATGPPEVSFGSPGPPLPSLPPLDHKPQARTGALSVAPVTVLGPAVRSPSPQFRKEPLGRSPSPIPRG